MTLRRHPIQLRSKEGREIWDFLAPRLGFPEFMQEVTIHLKFDDVIRVEMKYMPGVETDEP